MAAEPVPVRAAGAVLWRRESGRLEVALVHRPKYDDWSFPKGKAKPSEHILRTVRREVIEETGVTPRLGPRLPSIGYLKDDRPKRVDYWSATVESSVPFVPNDEIDEVRWTTVPQALGLLSYAHDANLLRTWSELPLDSRPVILLRHASAGEKRFWHGNDFLRPLDPRGRWEAQELAVLLRSYMPLRLLSSTAQRCVETLLPFSADASITTDPHYTIGSSWISDAVPRFRTQLRAPDDGLLLCTHGELVPDLVTAVCSMYDAKEPEDPALRKSAFWVFHLSPDTLVSLERHSPYSS